MHAHRNQRPEVDLHNVRPPNSSRGWNFVVYRRYCSHCVPLDHGIRSYLHEKNKGHPFIGDSRDINLATQFDHYNIRYSLYD